MTSKQRANLRALASKEESIFQVGKGNITPNMVSAVSDALEKRELVKLTVLKTAEDDAEDVLSELAKKLKAQPIATIGNKIILYRRSSSDKVKHIEF